MPSVGDEAVGWENYEFRSSHAPTPAGGDAPTAAILLQAGLAIALIMLSDLRGLLSYVGFTLLISAALSVASLFVIARKEGSRAVAVWGYPLTPVFYVAATLVLAAMAGSREPMQFLAAVITIVSGSVVYYALGLHKVAPPPVATAGAAAAVRHDT